LSFGFAIIVLRLLERPKKIMKKTEFKDSYGTITEGFNLKRLRPMRIYYSLFFIRRIFYVASLLVPIKYPTFQLIFIPSLLIIPVFY